LSQLGPIRRRCRGRRIEKELGRMPVATIAAFWGVSMLFVLTPGADWAYAIPSGLRHRNVARR
jgi:hypothetical protein